MCGFLVCASAPAFGQELFGPDLIPDDQGFGTARESAESSRFRYATVEGSVIGGSKISLNLFSDLSVEAVRTGGGRQFEADTWTGVIDGDPASSIVLALDDSGVLFGKVERAESTILIRPKQAAVHSILELSDPIAVDEGDDAVPLSDSGFDAANKGASASACLPSSTCSSKTIDVMVVYTSQARSALGGSHQSAKAAIAAAVAEMNSANSNSGVVHSFNLVFAGEIPYTESGDAGTDLSRLGNSLDGHMDQVHSWRDVYGADLVSLITDTGGCGMGYLQSDPTSLSPSAAFNVVRDDCLINNKSLAHEFGHNMGLHHDWYVNSSATPCPWHHGYVNQEAFGGASAQRWRTVMGYKNQCSVQGGFGCSRIAYWSNPLKSRNGDKMGVSQGQPKPSDAVFALNRTACQVANFRTSVSEPDPPASPSGLVASGVSPLIINVTWNDNAVDESGYRLERSPSGTPGWANIATLGANSQEYSDTGLAEGSTFYYRVYAYHSTGRSGFSNTDSAGTMVSYSDYVPGEVSVRYGSVSDGLSKTSSNDGDAAVVQEEETGGWPDSRTTRLDVAWRFDVPSGSRLAVHANAWATPSTDNDEMQLSWSEDGVSYTPMFVISETADTGLYQTYSLGIAAGPAIWIRLEDTDRNRGNRSADNVYVDHLFIRTEPEEDNPAELVDVPLIHLGDLRMVVTGKDWWASTVEATVHRAASHVPEAGVKVSGIWHDGSGAVCITGESGTCSVGRAWNPKDESATFSVTLLSKEGFTYDADSFESATTVTAIAPEATINVAALDEVPDRWELRQNYPNPFNPSTIFEFGVPAAGHVRVAVFNSAGMEVERLYDGPVEAGRHRVIFDGSSLSSGVYFAILQAPGTTQSRTMLLMK